MDVAVPTEVKNHEDRVAITPAGVQELTARGHRVHVQTGAGLGAGITDDDYVAAGARLTPDAATTWAAGELVLKVKEPVETEYEHLHAGQTLFTYLHLAADKALTEELLARRVTAVAYETVQTADGRLPLLAPMSEVAGRLATQVGAATLQNAAGGRGVLLGGVPGVAAAHVVIIGAGTSGMNAARVAAGMGARVTLLDKNVDVLRAADRELGGQVQTLAANRLTVTEAVLDADLVVGAVLVPGAKAPVLVSNDLVAAMRPGSVLVDVAIDQGGCFEDSHPTTHDRPTYRVHETVFYCVANMPGAVARTSTYALTNVTLSYAAALADLGWRDAMRADPALAAGLNTHDGEVVHAAVASAHSLSPVALDGLL
jgi:alanine dehydrogenase